MSGYIGTKYDAALDIADIAKKVRADIRAAIKAGTLPKGTKTSVRISRYTGGQRLNVYIKHLGGERVINPAWVKWHDENPTGTYSDGPPRYTATATAAADTIKAIIREYNFDHSQIEVDYFHNNFFGFVEFDYEFRKADEELSRREGEKAGFYPDESKEALDRAIEKGSYLKCTGDDDCPCCQVIKAATPLATKIVGFPVFNQREPYNC
jgi:hypothetical protein